LIASSPYSQRGELYNAYRRHFGRDERARPGVESLDRGDEPEH
jgi:hypothetical protein